MADALNPGLKPQEKKAKQRWSSLASAVAPESSESGEKSGSAAIEMQDLGKKSEETSTLRRRNTGTVTDTPDKSGPGDFAKRFKMMTFLSKFTNVVQNKKNKAQDQKAKEDAEFLIETRRRFLFDDAQLRRGKENQFDSEEDLDDDFNDVVDQDDRRIEVFVSQELVGKLLESTHFKFFIFALIVINSALIGLQTDYNLSVEYRYLFSIFDHGVLAIFICEILLKWYHGFWIFWQVGWNVLDFVIIVALLLGPQLSFLSSSRILRILRVLRAFRSLRSISALAGLSMVVQTILQSIPDMANICLLLTIILLMLGVAGVTLFGRNVPDRFGDLQTAMFSLFICVTQDGWVNIYKKFHGQGDWLYIGGSIYFIIAIVIGAFVFANLVVAVVVTNLEIAMKEMKQEKRAMVDTMAVEVQQDPDDPITENPERVPILTFKAVQKGVDFTAQTPLELADLKGLSVEKIEKYFTILTALEDNMAEYVNIKEDLIKMYEVIKSVNTLESVHSLDELDQWKKLPSRLGSNFNIKDLKRGDILSNLMKMEENMMVSSDGANNMDSIVRSTRNHLVHQATRPTVSSLRLDTRRQQRDDGQSNSSLK